MSAEQDGSNFGIIKFFIYSLLPIIGQLLMRINEFGGSLDKPWLLLFAIPPFSFIPVIAGKMGYIKHTGSSSPIDYYGLIPIIFRIILLMFLLDISSTMNLLIYSGLILLSILFANIIHSLTSVDCKDKEVNIFTRLGKSFSDSMIQYGSGVLGTFIINFIPFIGMGFKLIQFIPIANIDIIVESLVWGLGLLMGYLIINMYDVNYISKEDYCKGRIQTARFIIGFILLSLGIAYEWYNNVM